MKKILVFFVDNDEKKNKLIEERSAAESSSSGSVATIILLDIPWEWEVFVSKRLYEDEELGEAFRRLLNAVCTNGRWVPEESCKFPRFWRITNLGKMSQDQISRIYTQLGLEYKEYDKRRDKPVRHKDPAPKKQPEGKPASSKKPPPKKKSQKKRPYFDDKMAASGEKKD